MADLIDRQAAIDGITAVGTGCMPAWAVNRAADDLISRQAAIKEAYKIVIDGDAYEVVQVETLMGLPSVQPTLYGYNVKHLDLIARVLQKEDIPPERVTEVLTDIGRIVAIVQDEFIETLRRAVQNAEGRTDG